MSQKVPSEVQKRKVSRQESGQKILSYLKRVMGRDFPDSGLMKLIRTGQVRINGKRCKPFDMVSHEDIVRIPPHRLAEKQPKPKACLNPEIVFKNSDFLVLNKPGSLPVHAGTGHQDSLVARVHHLFKDDPFLPTPVHRLDKETSGLILFARSFSWLRHMQELWPSPDFVKTYLAWVRGRWKEKELNITDRLTRDQDRVRPDPLGKTAISQVKLLVSQKDMSLLKIVIRTGRTHQIRVHLAQRGFPIIGDLKYGNAATPVMYLHCFRLEWPGYKFELFPEWYGKFLVEKTIMEG